MLSSGRGNSPCTRNMATGGRRLHFLVAAITCMIIARYNISAACLFGTTLDCEFQCHCDGGATCDPDTGVCPGECAQDSPGLFTWSGEACQIGNVARGKNTSQTGTFGVFYSYQAVDGTVIDETHNEQKSVCAHPSAGRQNHAKWTVDLGGDYVIHNVTVFNTNEFSARNWSADFDVVVVHGSSGSHTCGHYTGVVPLASTSNAWRGTANISCDAHPIGRYVIIEKTGSYRPGVMTLCEVVVIGHKYHSCGECQDCSQVIGCRSCSSPGVKRPQCTEACDVGMYGLNCAESCSGHCGTGDPYSCSPGDGSCPGGCQQWYTGTDCGVFIAHPLNNGENVTLRSVGSSSVEVAWEQNNNLPEGAETHYGYRISYRTGDSGYTEGPDIPHTSGDTWRMETISGLTPNTIYDFKVEQYRTWGGMKDYGATLYGPTVRTLSTGASLTTILPPLTEAVVDTSPVTTPLRLMEEDTTVLLLALLGCAVVVMVILGTALVVAVVRHRGCRGVFNPSSLTKQRPTSVDIPPVEETRRSTAPPSESTLVPSESAHQENMEDGYETLGEREPPYVNPGTIYADIRDPSA